MSIDATVFKPAHILPMGVVINTVGSTDGGRIV